MGALTSKPFAFIARPWELKSIASIDLIDGEGINIKFNVRGNAILRVLPKYTDFLNSEWINDRVRFNYDGINRARFRFVNISTIGIDKFLQLANKKITTLKKGDRLGWEFALKHLMRLFNPSLHNLLAIMSPQTDIESVISVKNLLSRFGSSDLMFETNNTAKYLLPSNNLKSASSNILPFLAEMALDPDFRINAADLYILVGVNIRFESSVMYSKLLKQLSNSFGQKKFILFNSTAIAHGTNYQSDIFNVGNKPEVFSKLLEGRHKYSKIIAKAKAPLFIIGAEVALDTREMLYSWCSKWSGETSAHYQQWNPVINCASGANSAGISVLSSSNIGKFNMRYINSSNYYGILLLGDFSKPLQLINDNNRERIAFIINQKSFTDISMPFIKNVVELPQMHTSELRSNFMNQFYKKQSTEIAVTVSNDERKPADILRILFQLWALENSREADNLADLRAAERYEPLLKAGHNSVIATNATLKMNDNKELSATDLPNLGKGKSVVIRKNFNKKGCVSNNNAAHNYFYADKVSQNSAPMALAHKQREFFDFNTFNYKY